MNTDKTLHELYWRRVRRITAGLLAVWFVATFSIVFFARELSDLTFLGWPFSFYMAAQGLTLLYLAILLVYVYVMNHLDKTLKRESDHVQ